MRIFLSCQQALKEHPVPGYAFWEVYFKSALLEAGHQVIEAESVDWAEGLTPLSKDERARWLERTWTRAVEKLEAEHRSRPVDLFLSYLFPNQVEPSAVRAIRTLGIPTVNFFCDNIREFTAVPPEFRDFDLHWVPEADARELYTSARLPFIYAPMPMWVSPTLRTAPSDGAEGAVFIGSHDDLREDLLGEAIGLGFPIRVFGAGWNTGTGGATGAPRSFSGTLANQAGFLRTEGIRGWLMRATYQFRNRRPVDWIGAHANPPLLGDSYFTALRESRLVIGINRCPSFRRPFSHPLLYSRLRDIEGPMLGACYITEHAPGLEDLYDLGTEIETYRNAGELVEKSGRLLADPARRLALRRLGQRRALADHTIARSIGRITEQLRIPA